MQTEFNTPNNTHCPITAALSEISDYLDQHPEWDITTQQFEEYLRSPECFSFPLHFRESFHASDQEADDTLKNLKHSFSSQLRQRVLCEKWRERERLSNLNYFLDSMGAGGENHQVLQVEDLSTARSVEQGRFVHRLKLSLPGNEECSVFAKGHGLAENSPLLAFPGWENRPFLHLYETFFWQVAGIAGLVERNAGFFTETHDPHCIGYTLVEHIPGESADQLLEEQQGKMVLRPEFFRNLPSLIGQLARWSAFNELFRGGDRRTVHLNPDYHRPTNYLIAFRETGTLITGIDHELLFCKSPCIQYDRTHKAHEAALIEALPETAKKSARKIFSRAFLVAWKEFTRPELLDTFRHQIDRFFGTSSTEEMVFEASIRRQAGDILGELFNQKKGDFL